uniref:Uncharacterized protein n=1 Tax=Timema genevievae TaxID=629358 RepID=A0A7R9PQK3_TIMGE|nr:unnamed protein product [Timema genevievae]
MVYWDPYGLDDGLRGDLEHRSVGVRLLEAVSGLPPATNSTTPVPDACYGNAVSGVPDVWGELDAIDNLISQMDIADACPSHGKDVFQAPTSASPIQTAGALPPSGVFQKAGGVVAKQPGTHTHFKTWICRWRNHHQHHDHLDVQAVFSNVKLVLQSNDSYLTSSLLYVKLHQFKDPCKRGWIISERRVRSRERLCWFTTEVTSNRIPSVSSLTLATGVRTNSCTSLHNGSAGRRINAVSLYFMRATAHFPPPKNTATTTPEVSVLPIPTVLNTVPVHACKKAELLKEHIVSRGGISWDENGEVSIQDTLLRRSNIVDLVNDLVRARRHNFHSLIDDSKELIVKELSVLSVYGTLLQHWALKPPYGIEKLLAAAKKQADYIVNKLHGIPWESSDVDYSLLESIISHATTRAETVYVKGEGNKIF